MGEPKWWGHLNNKRSIQGGTKELQLKEKCKDSESSIFSKQHVDLDEEIKESIIGRHVYIKKLWKHQEEKAHEDGGSNEVNLGGCWVHVDTHQNIYRTQQF